LSEGTISGQTASMATSTIKSELVLQLDRSFIQVWHFYI
jgi:hypothetical protein